MGLEIATSLTLSQAQTICVIVLGLLGMGWLFFVHGVVKYLGVSRIRKQGSVPLRNVLIPYTLRDSFQTLLASKQIVTFVIAGAVVVGLILNSLESIIVVNTISYQELCKPEVIKSNSKIINHENNAAFGSHSDVTRMMEKRAKARVPPGTLTGHVPTHSNWLFSEKHDVNPFPWKSTCVPRLSTTMTSDVDTGILDGGNSTFPKLMPDIHAAYKFENPPAGYEYTKFSFFIFEYYNKTDNIVYSRGLLIFLIEEFKKGDTLKTGGHYMNKLWTLRIPESVSIPHDPQISRSVMKIPVSIKSYECDMERKNDLNRGDYNIHTHDLSALVSVITDLVGREWNMAVVQGGDTSTYEMTPEHWASYMSTKDTLSSKDEIISFQIAKPCIEIGAVYLALVALYITIIIAATILYFLYRKRGLSIPVGNIEWANLAYQSVSGFNRNSATHPSAIFSSAALRVSNFDGKEFLSVTDPNVTEVTLDDSELEGADNTK